MRRSGKHATRAVSFVGLNGGVNVSMPPEQITENEMQVCENFIYERDSKRLVGRGGLSASLFSFVSDIRELYYDVGTNTIAVFCKDRRAYNIDRTREVQRSIGSVTGDNIPVCAKFQNKLWVASGGKLQYYAYDDNGLMMINDSPVCDICFQRTARIFCTLTGRDNAYYSSVGDGATWEEDTNDKSMEQWAEVGYGDDGDICACVPMATDMFFLKTHGTWYQFTGDGGDPDMWSIAPVATGVDVVGKMCAVNIGNSVVYLSRRGLRSLNATMDYGNIATSDIGDRFNALITKGLVDTARMFHLRRHSMIFIRPTSDHKYIVAYNYLLGAVTTLNFAMPIESVIETVDDILIASGNSIYKMDVSFTTDNGEEINYRMKPRDVIGNEKMLIKAVDTKFTSDHAGTVTVGTDTLAITMPTNDRKKVRCNHSTDCISFEIAGTSRFEVDHISLDVADL